MLRLEPYGGGQALGQSQDQGQGVLGNHGTMNAASVGDNDVAGHDLRDQQLVHGGGGRVDPAQLAGGAEVLGTQDKGHGDVGIAQVLLRVPIAVVLHHL